MTTRSSSLFSRPGFTTLWGIGAIYGTVRWLEILSVSLYTFDATRSPLIVAAMMVARMSPMMLFGSILGAYADRFNRKHLLVTGLCTMTLVTATVLALIATEHLALWHLAIAVFLSGTFFSTDFPVRRTLLGEAAGSEHMGRAMSLDSATNSATRMLGPLAGGFIFQALGLAGVYSIGFIAFVSLIFTALRLPDSSAHHVRSQESLLRSLGDAWHYARRHPGIQATLAITVIINMFAFPVATMVPVIGRETMELSAVEVGFLASAEGMGALLGALILTRIVTPARYVRFYMTGSFIFALCVALFALMATLWMAWPILFIGGLGVAGFGAMQSTLIMANAEPAYRSRMMGLLAVCIGTGPIGILHVGAMAEWIGSSNAVYIMAMEGVGALLIATLRWPHLLRR